MLINDPSSKITQPGQSEEKCKNNSHFFMFLDGQMLSTECNRIIRSTFYITSCALIQHIRNKILNL